jgi:hypothetical protein
MATPIDVITRLNAPLLRHAPTPVVIRRWRKHCALEQELGARLRAWSGPRDEAYVRLVDEYDDKSDKAAAAYFVLMERGLEPCGYCCTLPPEPHHSATCPALLTNRLQGTA